MSKLNKRQLELLEELKQKTKEFNDSIPEEEKRKWPNGALYRPLRIIEQEYIKKIREAADEHS